MIIENVKNWQLSRNLIYLVSIITLIVCGVLIPSDKAWANYLGSEITTNEFLTLESGIASTGSTASYSTVRTPDSFSISNILLNPSAIEVNGYFFGLSQGEGVKVLRDGNVAYDAAYLGVESRNLVFSGKTINVLPMENITVRVCPYESGYMGSYYVDAYKYYEIPPANPVIALKDVSQTSIVMEVNPKGNRTGTLQRSSNNGRTWTTIYTQPDNRNTYIFTDGGLSPDKTYRYRTVHTSAGQTAYNYQGGNFYAEFTTASDPAVVAAQKAENAAQLAKVAAEQTLQYSLDAKNAALNAESKANITLQEVQDSTYGLSALRNEILNIKNTINTAPIIYSLKGVNNATATKTSQITLDASVSNATHYRVNNGSWQLYTKQIIVNGLTVGVNRIEIEFGNLNAELQGETVSTALTVFRLP